MMRVVCLACPYIYVYVNCPVTCNEDGDSRFKIGDVFMVFEYGDFDLAGLLDSEGVHLTHEHIRSYTNQLLEGVGYMHNQNILHRDLKSANILITRDNVLKIADWGLARQYRHAQKNLTAEVVTLWYRAPEVCYRTREYGPGVDIWAVGCIFAEFYNKTPIMKGNTDIEQLEYIYTLLGRPTGATKEVFSRYPDWEKTAVKEEIGKAGSKLASKFNGKMDGEAIILLEQMLQLNPENRISAKKALVNDYFYKPRKVYDPHLLERFTIENGHEFERQQYRKKSAADLAKLEKEKEEKRKQFNRPDGTRKSSKFTYVPPGAKSEGVKRDIRGMVRPSQSSEDIVQKAKANSASTSNSGAPTEDANDDGAKDKDEEGSKKPRLQGEL